MLFSLLLLCSPAACVNSDITSPASKAVALVADSVGRSETAVDRLFAVSREGNQTKTRVELPRVILDFPFPEMAGRTINVKAGDNLQSALNRARRGDEIVLEASCRPRLGRLREDDNPQPSEGHRPSYRQRPAKDYGQRPSRLCQPGTLSFAAAAQSFPAVA